MSRPGRAARHYPSTHRDVHRTLPRHAGGFAHGHRRREHPAAARAHRGGRPARGRAAPHHRRGVVPRQDGLRPGLDADVLGGRRDGRGGSLADLGSEPGARRAVGEHPRALRGAEPRRGLRVHRSGHQPSGSDLRHGPDDLRDREGEGGRARHPRARSLRADVHLAARLRVRPQHPGRRDCRRVAGTRLHPGRPLPVQRQEVRGRPGGGDGGDPEGLPGRGCRRLSQHRCRQLHARRPLAADRRRRAEDQLHPRSRDHRADPRPGACRRHDQRRRGDRRGRQAELERGRAAGVPGRLPPRARRSPPGQHRRQQGERSDRHEPRRRAAPRRRRGRGQARLRGPPRPRRGRPDLRRGRRRPARREHPPRRALPSLRRRRDGRDPPRDRASRTRSTSTPRSRPSFIARSRRGASRMRPASASPG